MVSVRIPIVKVGFPPPEEMIPRLQSVLYSGMIGEGEHVYAFERRFAAQFGLDPASTLAMSSGTAALHTSLWSAGIGPGCEVISTAMTAEPTNVTILHAGAKVVWADVVPETGNIDPASIASRITPDTKAIMVVHYAGYPAQMDEIWATAREHGLPVIEDCAHALGARCCGVPVGSRSDYGIYSLQAIKHMTTVDGGIFTTVHKDRVTRAKRFRWFGLEKGVERTVVDITEFGYKYNMSNVTAAIGLAQLDVIEKRIARHRANGRFFDEALSKVNGVRPASVPDACDPSYWLYTLLCDDANDIEKLLTENGIAASKLHKRNDEHSVFASSRSDLPGLDKFYARMLHIPCGWWVTDEDREQIIDLLRKG